jgi:hypothetical protein
VFDAEHFFDGYKDDPDYALSVVSESITLRSSIQRSETAPRREESL